MPIRLTLALSLAAVLAVPFPAASLFAAEPVPTDTIDMSVAVGRALTEVLELMNAGKLDEADAAMQQLRQQPLNDYESTSVLKQAINLHITMGKHDQAIADHEELLQKPNLPEQERTSALLMLGKLYLQIENWNKGVETLLQANQAQGGSSMETLYLIAFGYYRSQQPALATQYLEQSIAVGGAQAAEPHYSLLGVLYVDAKNYPKAIEAYEKLFSAVPNPTQAESYYSTLAQLYAQAGDKAKARSTLEQLIAKFPNSAKLNDYRTRLAAVK